MRNVLILGVLLALGSVAVNTASAADVTGQIPQATLQAMGLEGVQAVSDSRGEAIRGKGFVVVQAATAHNQYALSQAWVFVKFDCCPNKFVAVTGAAVDGRYGYNYVGRP